ncbi:MAG: recombinase family protein [Patescibacteria group bacterium]
MKYFIYCRKSSTDNEDKQILSLDSQESELLQLADANSLDVVEVLRESKSAKAEGRPVFNEMIRQIRKGKAQGIICWKLDRLARNFIDGGQIIDLLQRGTIKEIRTHEAIHLPSDNVLLLAVNLGMANQYIRDLSENVKRGNRAKLEKGEWPAPAPFGYRKLKGKVVIDKSEAPFILRMYEMYATGEYSLLQVTKILFEDGFRTPTGKRVMPHTLRHMLKNKFYLGLMNRQGKIYQGNHKPLISQAQFDRVQDVLHGRHHAKPKKHFYSARGFLTCANCGCMLTADTKKGHQYYYCTNGKGICDEHRQYLKAETIDLLLSEIFTQLRFDEELIEISGQAYLERLKTNPEERYLSNSRETLQKELQGLDESESLLTDAMASRVLKRELYDEKMRGVADRRVELLNQLSQMGIKGEEPEVTIELIKEVFLVGNKASNSYLALSPEEKRHTLGKLLSNASIKDKNMAQWQFKSPYDVLARTPKSADFLTVCAG